MRTLDDIVPPSRRPSSGDSRSNEPLRIHSKKPRFPYGSLGVVAVIIVGAFGALIYFSSAKVDVTPSSSSVTLQNSFTATQGSGDLAFEVITATKVATQSVQGSGTKTVNQKAQGQITIYNQQAKAQKLIANTRFATTAGLVYRINTAVTVPAGTTANPGTVKATIYADQVGDSYNVGPTSFTLPGLAGSPEASKVYAKSTTPMSGGASGTVPVVDSATENTARQALMSALAPQLESELLAQIPDGYILIPGAATTTFSASPSAPSSTTGMVDIKEEATAVAVVFPETSIAKAVAGSTLGAGYQGGGMSFGSYSGLTLTAPSMPSSDSPTFTFSLSGTANLVYVVDPSRIAGAVAGKTRQAAEVALTNYPEVKKAVLILRPFWRSSFPEDPASITVTVQKP